MLRFFRYLSTNGSSLNFEKHEAKQYMKCISGTMNSFVQQMRKEKTGGVTRSVFFEISTIKLNIGEKKPKSSTRIACYRCAE